MLPNFETPTKPSSEPRRALERCVRAMEERQAKNNDSPNSKQSIVAIQQQTCFTNIGRLKSAYPVCDFTPISKRIVKSHSLCEAASGDYSSMPISQEEANHYKEALYCTFIQKATDHLQPRKDDNPCASQIRAASSGRGPPEEASLKPQKETNESHSKASCSPIGEIADAYLLKNIRQHAFVKYGLLSLDMASAKAKMPHLSGSVKKCCKERPIPLEFDDSFPYRFEITKEYFFPGTSYSKTYWPKQIQVSSEYPGTAGKKVMCTFPGCDFKIRALFHYKNKKDDVHGQINHSTNKIIIGVTKEMHSKEENVDHHPQCHHSKSLLQLREHVLTGTLEEVADKLSHLPGSFLAEFDSSGKMVSVNEHATRWLMHRLVEHRAGFPYGIENAMIVKKMEKRLNNRKQTITSQKIDHTRYGIDLTSIRNFQDTIDTVAKHTLNVPPDFTPQFFPDGESAHFREWARHLVEEEKLVTPIPLAFMMGKYVVPHLAPFYIPIVVDDKCHELALKLEAKATKILEDQEKIRCGEESGIRPTKKLKQAAVAFDLDLLKAQISIVCSLTTLRLGCDAEKCLHELFPFVADGTFGGANDARASVIGGGYNNFREDFLSFIHRNSFALKALCMSTMENQLTVRIFVLSLQNITKRLFGVRMECTKYLLSDSAEAYGNVFSDPSVFGHAYNVDGRIPQPVAANCQTHCLRKSMKNNGDHNGGWYQNLPGWDMKFAEIVHYHVEYLSKLPSEECFKAHLSKIFAIWMTFPAGDKLVKRAKTVYFKVSKDGSIGRTTCWYREIFPIPHQPPRQQAIESFNGTMKKYSSEAWGKTAKQLRFCTLPKTVIQCGVSSLKYDVPHQKRDLTKLDRQYFDAICSPVSIPSNVVSTRWSEQESCMSMPFKFVNTVVGMPLTSSITQAHEEFYRGDLSNLLKDFDIASLCWFRRSVCGLYRFNYIDPKTAQPNTCVAGSCEDFERKGMCPHTFFFEERAAKVKMQSTLNPNGLKKGVKREKDPLPLPGTTKNRKCQEDCPMIEGFFDVHILAKVLFRLWFKNEAESGENIGSKILFDQLTLAQMNRLVSFLNQHQDQSCWCVSSKQNKRGLYLVHVKIVRNKLADS